jgi:hypothetical protein
MVGTKIFGIGLYRTGTSSLHVALNQLGFRTVHHHQFLNMVEALNRWKQRKLLWGIEDQYDCFFDGRLMYRYKELDEQYPGSKFICTRRDEDSWVRSIMRRRHDDTLRRVPMLADLNEARWRQLYRQHYAGVEVYFGQRADVLHLSVCRGEGWERLCPWLGVPVPSSPFPRENAADAAVAPFWQNVA